MQGLIYPNITKFPQLWDAQMSGVLCIIGTNPIGMLLGLPHVKGKMIRLISLRVEKEYQNQGVGSELFRRMEKELAQRGFESIELLVDANWSSVKIVEHMLESSHWSNGAVEMRNCTALIEKALPVFPGRPKLPEGYAFKSWLDVSEAEKRNVKLKQQEGWFPPELSPFQFVDRLEQENSVALYYMTELVGWMILVKEGEETLEYPALFVDPAHRSFKISHSLIGEAVHRQMKLGKHSRFVFSAQADNPVMFRFLDRNSKEHGWQSSDLIRYSKQLNLV